MSTSRRDFLKFVVAGSVAAGCPIDLSLLAAPEGAKPHVDGEHFDICHQVRDHQAFDRPPISRKCGVLIAGGGASGLSAAYFLRDHDFLLLEKEPHWGGNANLEEYDGQAYATGSAFDYKGSASEQLAREIGLTPLAINSADPTIINGKWVDDTWGAGLDQLPYAPAIRNSFRKFREDMLALAAEKNQEQFDVVPLSKYLKDYAPEVKQWWDCYGPSNYGAKSEDTSTMVALGEIKDLADYANHDARVTLPGGNGTLTRKLAEILHLKSPERMISDATIIAIEPQNAEVHVTYSQNGALYAVAAKFVIVATPKLIAARIVSGLPEAQVEAMKSIRYCPYAVVNMIFDKPVYNRAYDTWCPGTSFADMVVSDWVSQKQPGYKQKNNILTFYTPISEADRYKLLTLDGCRMLAANVLRDFHHVLPEANAEPIEVHLYRRGHAVFLSSPGTYTKTIPAARRPLDRIAFANTDSLGPESLVYAAVEAAHRSAEWAIKRISGASLSSATSAAGFAV
ncbi:MAG: FAD-dependent oxidoreductase [Candidatus Acidiferrales bacterium]